jgi:CRISPR-associated protein Cmr1
MKMKKIEFTVQFVTPAFLGNAEQSAQWRTPPFKTLLRQWWRVLNAHLSVSDLRKKEGQTFGAALDDTGLQSRVRLRLDSWSNGKMKEWPSDPTTPHKEVRNGMSIGSHLYLGYGPLRSASGTKLKGNAAIQANESGNLSLICDVKKVPMLDTHLVDVMQLAHWFGTLGGRSRNGWGSAQFTSKNQNLMSFDQLVHSPLIDKITMPLSDCLNFDYPGALGSDSSGLLLWKAKMVSDSWENAMKELARIKIALRTSFSLAGHSRGGSLEDRHVLSYPLTTNHDTRDYDKNARLPNQLRFKVHKTSDGKYMPVAFHFPVKTPESVLAKNAKSFNKQEQLVVWQQAHKKMDELMTRITQ